MITAKIRNPYIADGICTKCESYYCIISLEERKVRNGFCGKCKESIEMWYRELIIDSKPMICFFCKLEPVFVERPPEGDINIGDGHVATFHMKSGKVEPHACDGLIEAYKVRLLKKSAEA